MARRAARGSSVGPLAFAVLSACRADAHDLGLVRAELRELDTGHYRLEVKLPPIVAFETESPTLPPRCRFEGAPEVTRFPAVTLMRFQFDCGDEPLGSRDALYLPWRREGAFVTARFRDGTAEGRFFDDGEGGIEIDLGSLRTGSGPPAETVRRYLPLGIEHILTGWDHLAFVLGLCLLAAGFRLVRLVTAFTLGHSATLALAAFGLVHVPIPPLEACIALSVALVARQALADPGSARHRAGLVFAFGLLHGLGFASALGESGIPRPELLVGLVSFNFGVEIGQLGFVAVVVAASRAGRSLPGGGLRPLVAYSLGTLSLFWTLERIAAFLTPSL
jgi:hydrogenase/urease accessory protein HupE